jgi:uncharacterized protein (TIGR02757 family)
MKKIIVTKPPGPDTPVVMEQKPFFSHPERFRKTLDQLYDTYNRRELVTPDPLQFLYGYDALRDREIVGLIASSLAYGRVAQIIRSIEGVLAIMGASPYEFIMETENQRCQSLFQGFCHRFAKTDALCALLSGVKQVINRFGSIERCVSEGLRPEHETLHPAMVYFAGHLLTGERSPGHLLSLPWKKSACKRLNLFLRWMVRKDQVDPGGWETIPREKLIVPLDTHIHQISLALGLTGRSDAGLATALEITTNFRKINLQDPVRYDFVLSRFGIRQDMNRVDLIREF